MERVFSGFAVAFLLGSLVSAQAIHSRGGFTLPAPPEAEKIPVTDDYFGTKVVDDYRWLENADSPETKAFIDQENVYTARYMEQARIRPQIADDLDALEHVSSWTRADPARKRSVLPEAVGGRGTGIDLCAARMGGEGQAACRSGAVQPRPQYVSRTGGRIARRIAGGLLDSPGRRGRDHGARVRCEDRQDARG